MMAFSMLLPVLVLLVSGPAAQASAHIVISPEDVNTRLGRALLLPCVVVATHNSSTVHVIWKHNGQPINHPTPHLQVHPLMASQRDGVKFIKSVLEVCVSGAELAGNYSCTAMDGQETIDQETFHINPTPIPVHILVAPTDMDVTATNSSTIAVRCVAMGMPHPHITWQRNSYTLTESSGRYIHENVITKNGLDLVVSTLTICPLHPRGGGQYTCEAQNQYSRTEVSFAVSTQAAATESGSATAQNVTVGESHTFTCVFLGFPPPTMSWAFNGRPIADGATFVTEQQAQIESRGVIMTRSHLSFTVHSTMFTGRYKCMAAGDAREYQLHVQVPAEILVAPVGPSHGLPSSVVVTCVAYGVPPPVVTWKYGDSLVSDRLLTRHTHQELGYGSGVAVVTSSLEVCPVQENTGSGWYSCEVENGVTDSTSTKSSLFRLCFMGNFGLLVAPADQDIVTGGVYYLPCVAFSKNGGHVVITWRANGSPINGKSSQLAILETNRTQNGVNLLSSILVLSCATPEDALEYTCSATDGMEYEEEAFTLHFSLPPVIEGQSDEKGRISKEHNSDLSLFCIVSGHPTPSVTWLKDGHPLERDEGFSVQESDVFDEAGRTLVNSTLTLSGLTMADNGYYVCRAKNDHDQVDLLQGYNLSVKVPDIPGVGDLQNKAVEYASYSGSVLCVLPLLAVVIIHLASNHLRSMMETVPVLNFCIATSVLYLFYIPSSNVPWSDIACILFSSLFHFSFLLAAFSCFSLVLLRALRDYRRAKLVYTIAIVLNWGLPVLCLVVSLVPDINNYNMNDRVCIPLKWPLWFGLLLPFAVTHVISWIILIVSPFLVLKGLHEDNPAVSFRDALAVGSILVLFDLAWVLQVIALSAEGSMTMATTLQSIFIASSACLGVLSLLYFCFLQPHVKKALFQCTSPEENSSPKLEESTSCHTANGSAYGNVMSTAIIDQSFVGSGRESGMVNKMADL